MATTKKNPHLTISRIITNTDHRAPVDHYFQQGKEFIEMDQPQDSEPPKTPPNQLPAPSTPPTPRGKSPRVRASYDCGNRDKLGPQYWEYHDKTPNFAVSPLKGGDFKERLSVIEWADKLGYK